MSKTVTPVMGSQLITITSSETAKAAIGEVMIAQMKQACDICRSIEIVDDGSLQVARQQFTALNKTIKAIDAQRKKIKEPYFRAGKLIDEAANMLVEEAEAVIEEGKKKITAYEEVAKSKADEMVAQAELDAEATIAEAQAKADESNRIANLISEYEKNTIEAFTKAKNIAELKAVHEKFIKPGFPSPETWGDQTESARQLLIRITAFKDMRKAALLQEQDMKEKGVELTALEKKKVALQLQMQQLEAEEAAEAERVLAEQAAAEKRRQEEEMARARELSKVTQSEVNVGSMRETISFDLVDWKMVPDQWKQLNEDMVKAYIKEHKGKLANGSIVNGVIFSIERKPVL